MSRTRVFWEQLPQRMFRAAPVLPGLGLLVLTWASYGGGLVDDAYISLSYARSMAHGHGLVFHPDLPVTEGYSNLLWTLLLSLSMLLGAQGPAAAIALGLILAGLVIALVVDRIGGLAGAAVGLALGASPLFAFWAGKGLESALLSALLLVGVLRLGRPSAWLIFGLIGVTRVEGLAYGLLPLAHWALTRPAGQVWPDRRALAMWLGPSAIQLVFRLITYGEMVPSPVSAKLSSPLLSRLGDGFEWFASAPLLEPVLLVLVLFAAGRAIVLRRGVGPGLWPALGLAGVFAYALAVGGDWMPNLRWLAPAVPLAWLVAAGAVPRKALTGLALVSAVYGVAVDAGSLGVRSWARAAVVLAHGPLQPNLHKAHRFVLRALPESEAVLMPDIGLLSWMTGNPVLDPQGLAWRDVATAMQMDLSGPAGEAQLEQVRQTVKKLKPALVALTMDKGGAHPLGPVATALLGSKQPWFTKGWSRWQEQRYGGDATLVYYLRTDITAILPPSELRSRLNEATLRVPGAAQELTAPDAPGDWAP